MLRQHENYFTGFKYYVPGLQAAGHEGRGHGSYQFSIGTPSAADDDAIDTGIDLDGAANLSKSLSAFTTSGDGATATGKFGRNVVVSPSGDPGGATVVEVRGRDYLGQMMRERLTIANGQTTDTIGVKAFKYVDQWVLITPAVNAVTATLGWGIWFGIPYKMSTIESGMEGDVPVGAGSPIARLGSGNVTISGANAGTINAPFKGYLIGAYAVVTTAVTVAPSTLDAVVAGVGKAVADIVVPIAAPNLIAKAVLDRENAVAVDQGDACVWTSDAGATAGVAEIFAEFSRGLLLHKPSIMTDPQTATTSDPRGMVSPMRTPDAVIEFVYEGRLDSAVNAANNGGLHGIAHYNG